MKWNLFKIIIVFFIIFVPVNIIDYLILKDRYVIRNVGLPFNFYHEVYVNGVKQYGFSLFNLFINGLILLLISIILVYKVINRKR